MPITDRRTLLRSAAALPLATATANMALAQGSETASGARRETGAGQGRHADACALSRHREL